jgi:hypothetical protein
MVNDIADDGAGAPVRISVRRWRGGGRDLDTEPQDLFQNRPGADAFRPFIAIIQREVDTVVLDSPRATIGAAACAA